MPPRAFQKIRPKDHTILLHINEGTDDVRQLNKAITLSHRQINYAFNKLEDYGLIDVTRPDGQTTEIIQGQKHVYPSPKIAELTAFGDRYLAWIDRPLDPEADIHTDEGIDNLAERVTALEKKVNRIENQLNQLQRWVKTFRNDLESFRTTVTEHLPGLDASDAE